MGKEIFENLKLFSRREPHDTVLQIRLPKSAKKKIKRLAKKACVSQSIFLLGLVEMYEKLLSERGGHRD